MLDSGNSNERHCYRGLRNLEKKTLAIYSAWDCVHGIWPAQGN